MTARVETVGMEDEITQRLPWLDGVAGAMEQAADHWSTAARNAANHATRPASAVRRA